jgi:hypothetical protein
MLFAVPYTKRFLIVGIALFAGFSARAQDLTPKPSVGDTLLDPSSITITGHFESPSRASAVQLAIRNISDQIDRKRDADAAEAAMDRLWTASFLGFIPIKPGGHPGTMNSPVEKEDDPFFTPAYLTVVSRQLDREVAASDKRAKFLFGH